MIVFFHQMKFLQKKILKSVSQSETVLIRMVDVWIQAAGFVNWISVWSRSEQQVVNQPRAKKHPERKQAGKNQAGNKRSSSWSSVATGAQCGIESALKGLLTGLMRTEEQVSRTGRWEGDVETWEHERNKCWTGGGFWAWRKGWRVRWRDLVTECCWATRHLIIIIADITLPSRHIGITVITSLQLINSIHVRSELSDALTGSDSQLNHMKVPKKRWLISAKSSMRHN